MRHDDTRHRCGIDNLAIPSCEHHFPFLLAADEQATQIDGESLIPFRKSSFLGRGVSVNASIVECDVQLGHCAVGGKELNQKSHDLALAVGVGKTWRGSHED